MNPRAASKIRAHWGAAGSLRAEDTRQIEFLETALEDANEEVAEAAAEALTRLIRGIYPEIGQALEDAAIFVQEQRQNLLAPTAATFPLVLVRALGNAETYVRGCTIRALVRVGVPMLPDLREALTHSEALVRTCAAWTLGEIGDQTAIPALATLLQDPKRMVRDGAGQALARFGSLAVPTLLEAMRDERSRLTAVEALGWIGEASVAPALLDAMRTADLNGTWECWMAFRRIGQAARPYVLEGLQDPDEFRRASAVAALSAIGDTGDVSVFVEALQDPGRYGRVRIRAAEALTEIPHAAAVPALIKALQDEHESVRVEAVSALGACGDTASVVPQMALALADVSPRVQGRAWGVLAEMESAAIPVLEELLVDPREPVRFGAATALLEVDENSYPQSRDLPRRILLLPGVPPERKADALETLEKAHFPLPPPADLCRKLRKEPDTRLRQAATDVLRCLKDRKTGRGRWRILRLTRI